MKLHSDPIIQFQRWFDKASTSGIEFPEACCLSTIDEDSYPDSRMVLMKSFDNDGFVFYTNSTSRKGSQLKKNPRASLTFYWEPISRQVRIQGDVLLVTNSIADEYFSSRPRGSQIGAWASNQSKLLATRHELKERFRDFQKKYADRTIPRPPHWWGYRLYPRRMEYWIGRENRLHDRFVYEHEKKVWCMNRLYP